MALTCGASVASLYRSFFLIRHPCFFLQRLVAGVSPDATPRSHLRSAAGRVFQIQLDVAQAIRMLSSSPELGASADDVEHNLRTMLDVTARWDAVLLIDESDVFLEKRSTQDLARNKVVAVFPRLLEYYSGIIFITTNRADTLDPAFHSSIHLTIQYPPLNKNAKQPIWENLVNSSSPDHALSKADYLASLDKNGRQTKNSVKIAQPLEIDEKTKLGRDHFQKVLKISQGVSDPRLGNKCRWVFH